MRGAKCLPLLFELWDLDEGLNNPTLGSQLIALAIVNKGNTTKVKTWGLSNDRHIYHGQVGLPQADG